MLKILTHCVLKSDATSFYRGWGPLNHLVKIKRQDIQLIDIRQDGIEIDWHLMQQADILFMQRPSINVEVAIIQRAKACNIPVWIDYDDDYLNIPETNPRYHLYGDPHRQEQVKRCIELADIISVSTVSIMLAIAEKTGKDKKCFRVIPNAVDETIFDTSLPTPEEVAGRDVVLWRGGDTHDHDFKPYLDKIAQLYNDFPQYKWAFIGFPPAELLKMIDNNRVLLYSWSDVMGYFKVLFDIKPKIAIVPWAKNVFNESKSNCSWIESTVAGAVTLFPKWSTESVSGMAMYNNEDDFFAGLRSLMDADYGLYSLLSESYKTLERFTLSKVNDLRSTLIDELRQPVKMSFRRMQQNVDTIPDEGRYLLSHEERKNQQYEEYRKTQFELVEYLITRLKPENVVEFGSGPGGVLEALLDSRIPGVVGFDKNPDFYEYFCERNPHYSTKYLCTDFTEHDLDGVADLGIAIETFERVPQEIIEPFIAKLHNNFKYFYFSSTPYRNTKEDDIRFGRLNVHPRNYWISLFEQSGWKCIENPKKAAEWDCLFERVVGEEIKEEEG